jgi:hypothetical protein
MFRRLFWMCVGLGAGATAAVMTARWSRRQRERMAPANVARRASEGLSDLGSTLVTAWKEYREASDEREAEIRARMDNP